MAFFFNAVKTGKDKTTAKKHIPIETMQQMGCKACPLDSVGKKLHPIGDEQPDVYLLGEFPSIEDEERGEPFAQREVHRLLRNVIPSSIKSYRMHNTIRCAPKDGVANLTEIECCRKYIEEDIALTKPKVIVGAGPMALSWATKIISQHGTTALTNISSWRGKPVLVDIGGHTCWFYPIVSPSFVLKRRSNYGKSEQELVFEYDWKEISKLVRVSVPEVAKAPYDEGIIQISGQRGKQDLILLEDAFQDLLYQPVVGLDLETKGLRPYREDALIYTCAVGTFDRTYAFCLDHPDGWNSTLKKEVWGRFIEYLTQSKTKVAHKLKFELEWLCYFIDEKIAYITDWQDTLLLSHTLDERKGIHSLDDLIRQHFGFFLKDQSRIDTKKDLTQYPISELLRYNGMDSKWDQRLYVEKLRPMVYAEEKLRVEYERKLRLEPALVLTQMRGVYVDFDYAQKMNDELLAEAARIEKDIANTDEVKKYERRFGKFSPSSSDQVIKLMKDICGRKEIQKEKGEGVTSDVDALSKIPADEVRSAPLILEHRATNKLLSTYVIPVLTSKVVMPDGKIHTDYSSTIAETGRLNSEDPNMQNFPKRKHKKIRGMVIPHNPKFPDQPGWFFALDYGQLEARVFAWATEDKNLIKYLWTGYDIHGVWCDEIMASYPKVKDRLIVDYSIDKKADDADKKIRKSFRDEIKNGWVFPQFFGSQVRSCAANLKIPENIMEKHGRKFWDEFKGVKKWQENLLSRYERTLSVETLQGRKRRGVLNMNQIINHPIQGTAADLVEETMAEITEYALLTDNKHLQPNLNIHDDLTFSMPDSLGEDGLMENLDTIVGIMCKHRFPFINVPVVVEASAGPNWYELKEIGVYRSDELFNLKGPK